MDAQAESPEGGASAEAPMETKKSIVDREAAAATRIQSIRRGNQARKEVKEKQPSEPRRAIASLEAAGPEPPEKPPAPAATAEAAGPEPAEKPPAPSAAAEESFEEMEARLQKRYSADHLADLGPVNNDLSATIDPRTLDLEIARPPLAATPHLKSTLEEVTIDPSVLDANNEASKEIKDMSTRELCSMVAESAIRDGAAAATSGDESDAAANKKVVARSRSQEIRTHSPGKNQLSQSVSGIDDWANQSLKKGSGLMHSSSMLRKRRKAETKQGPQFRSTTDRFAGCASSPGLLYAATLATPGPGHYRDHVQKENWEPRIQVSSKAILELVQKKWVSVTDQLLKAERRAIACSERQPRMGSIMNEVGSVKPGAFMTTRDQILLSTSSGGAAAAWAAAATALRQKKDPLWRKPGHEEDDNAAAKGRLVKARLYGEIGLSPRADTCELIPETVPVPTLSQSLDSPKPRQTLRRQSQLAKDIVARLYPSKDLRDKSPVKQAVERRRSPQKSEFAPEPTHSTECTFKPVIHTAPSGTSRRAGSPMANCPWLDPSHQLTATLPKDKAMQQDIQLDPECVFHPTISQGSKNIVAQMMKGGSSSPRKVKRWFDPAEPKGAGLLDSTIKSELNNTMSNTLNSTLNSTMKSTRSTASNPSAAHSRLYDDAQERMKRKEKARGDIQMHSFERQTGREVDGTLGWTSRS